MRNNKSTCVYRCFLCVDILQKNEPGVTVRPDGDKDRPALRTIPDSEISIADLISDVKDDSGSFFKYLPDAKAKKLVVVTAYINKESHQQTRDVQAPQSNVQNASADNDSVDNISQSESVVNEGDAVAQTPQQMYNENTKKEGMGYG